ncbi:MAG: glycosyl hydrolase family 18 protein [Halanaerobiales bacterium]
MTYQVLGFHLAYSKSGLETIKEHHRVLNQIIPTWLEVKANGDLKINKSNKLIEAFIDKDMIIPMVQNADLDSSISNDLISNQGAVDLFIKNILSYIEEENFNEICIDIEGINYKNKNLFSSFIKKVADFLHQHGFSLSVVVPAKLENNQDSTWSGAYEYSSLAEAVDRIIIMAYDFHWPGGSPGPIAPLSWVQDVVDYAIMEIPLEKIFLGLGLYGYDWTIKREQRARGLVYEQIRNIVEKYNITTEWDQDSQSPYFRYIINDEEHEVWFENKESIAKKLKLISEFQLKGVVFWRLGQEDSDLWKVLRNI